MKIVNESVLDLFRGHGRCELCHRSCTAREPHHIWAKGIGGGGRLDVRINLVALGATASWQCECHTRIHNGGLKRDELLIIVALREGITTAMIVDRINELRRLPKESERPSWAT